MGNGVRRQTRDQIVRELMIEHRALTRFRWLITEEINRIEAEIREREQEAKEAESGSRRSPRTYPAG